MSEDATARDCRNEWIWNRAYYKWIDEGRPEGQGVRHYLEACREYDEMWLLTWNRWNKEAILDITVRVAPGYAPQAAIQEHLESFLEEPIDKIFFHNGFLIAWLKEASKYHPDTKDWRCGNFPKDWTEAIRKDEVTDGYRDIPIRIMRYQPVPEKAA